MAGGTFRLYNHPTAEWTRAGFGYGLRVDGLFDGNANSRVVFDFDDVNAAMYLTYNAISKKIIIRGVARGGVLSGDTVACNAVKYGKAPPSACQIINPRLYDIVYFLNHIKVEPGNTLTSKWADSKGVRYADDYGYVQARGDATAYAIQASSMAPVSFYVNVGGYRNYKTTYSGYGWVDAPFQPISNLDVLHYRDWGFILCDNEGDLPPIGGGGSSNCTALGSDDRLQNYGGTYRIRNHPKAEWTRDGFGYGLRVDGLFTGNNQDRVVFDFNRPDKGAAMWLFYDKLTGLVHLFGFAWGGQLNGNNVECNKAAFGEAPAEVCSFIEPRLWQIDFRYNHISLESSRSFTSRFSAQDGGTITSVSGTPFAQYNFGASQMEPVVFFMNVNGYRNYSDAYSAYGWVTVNGVDAEFRDWGFVINECDCTGQHSLIPNGGQFQLLNSPRQPFGLRLDGALGGNTPVVFDFNRQDLGALVYLIYERASSLITIRGRVYGGQVADIATCASESGCAFTNPRVYNITFVYRAVSEVTVNNFINIVSAATSQAGEGGLIFGDSPFNIARAAGGLEFHVDLGYQGVTAYYTGYGPLDGTPAGGVRAWEFLVGPTNCPVPCTVDCPSLFRDQCVTPGICAQCRPGYTEVVGFPNSRCSATCSAPTPCASLNRAGCRDTPNTCGRCLNGFVGAAGDANSACTPLSGSPILRVNAGAESAAPSGWSADFGSIGGGTAVSLVPIAGASGDLQFVYQTNRYWPGLPSSYAVPVYQLAGSSIAAGGNFLVRLHFANLYPGTAVAGQRVFDIYVNDKLALANYDIIAAAGATEKAVFEDFIVNVPASVGVITISARARTEAPQISGIEVFAA